MLTPKELRDITLGAEDIAERLHIYLIKQIVKRMMIRLGRGEKYLFTATDKWRIDLMQESGRLLSDIQAELATYTNMGVGEIQQAMQDALIVAIDRDDKVYNAAGFTPQPVQKSPLLMRLAQRAYNATKGLWQNLTRTTARQAQKVFINKCDEAYEKVVTGAESYTKAVKDAVEDVGRTGVRTVDYDTGHTDTIETATARAVRTGVAQCCGDVSMERMKEMDWDIILVSAHLGARTGDGGQNPGNHYWWQGKFYSRSGRDKRFPPFSLTGYGTGEGLCGWNCRHSFGSGDGEHNPYDKFDSAENKRMEMLEKRQRAIERGIRKIKREVVALQTAVDNCQDPALKQELQDALDKKSLRLQQQNKAYDIYCEKNKLRPQNERRQIAEWNRQTAAKAAATARRAAKNGTR